MTNTWGIPGTTFLAYYIGTMAAIVVLAAIHRRILFRGPRDVHVDNLNPQQVAYLSGGERLAVYAAMGGLRTAGTIGTGPGGTLVETGPLPPGATALDNALDNAARRGVRARELHDDFMVVSALDQIRDGLERLGLTVSPAQRREARIWGFVAGAVTLIGAARLVIGVANDKPVGYLFVCLVVSVVITIALLRVKRRATNSAVRALRTLRRSHDHLKPSQSPAYATYGVAGSAMGVALFGSASLYAIDPAFAAEAEVTRVAAYGYGDGGATAGATGSASGCSTGSCGGGGGCGGGGCGG
ncbi:TIGR04222 domain-containing membrane protein [Actinoplanes sp. TBRC 11911]|uniref:TIGR04222 domain-containing membrane protein n=1 Tax=Actinoplanes sp. TBRC 11911 TaxID=2729386 RepID=UPI00145F5310|nr:TIGR04222 domain-containing membrane protein [Actinoplanes sp. TBRC 11911]NMO57096.1 TIGR04222 domain-containing membrane protein [Actinoplanes sp. TBRC 11911]